MESDELLPGNKNASGRYIDDGDADGGDGGRRLRSGGAMGQTRSFTIPLVMPGISTIPRAKSAAGLLARQSSGDEMILSAEDEATADVTTAISRDLVRKAERWKMLAGEQLVPHDVSQMPLLGDGVDKHEVASAYVRDALTGRECSACMHDKKSLRALKMFRNTAWNYLLNTCTVVHLILPMIEIQRCLPCIHLAELPDAPDANSLFIGWRPTALGSMWIESAMCLLYATHLRQEALSRLANVPVTASERMATESDEDDEEIGYRARWPEVYSIFALPPWQLARTLMVTFIGLTLAMNLSCHYLFGITWFSWRHVILPWLFISRRTYLKHFVTAIIRLLPRMLPVIFLTIFVTFLYGFMGYIIYRDEPHPDGILPDLDLFDSPASSALTFLRIFAARSFIIDVDKSYEDVREMEVMVLSYAVIMFIFFLGVVPAVANHNFTAQFKNSYYWVKEQRKLALTRAFLLLKQPDGTLARGDYVQLMQCLRPDCDQDHTSALFSAAKKAERLQSSNTLAVGDDRNKVSKTGFFMLCALGTADVSRRQNARRKMFRSRSTRRSWERFRRRLDSALSWSRPGSNFPVSQQVLNVALLIQGYQIVLAGDDPEGRPVWTYPLGAALIAYFTIQALLRMIAAGAREFFMEWRNVFEMSLNGIGIAYYGEMWPRGQNWHNMYQILQASRLELLWNYMHLLGPASSEVATRLEFVFPSVIRAAFVLFSVSYSYAVVGYAMYCSTPLGTEPIEEFADLSMFKRFAGVKEVASFASLPQSYGTMLYVVMFSNWPMFMDAAGVVVNLMAARIFFYSLKLFTFYFLMPVLLGSTVTAYVNVHVPTPDSRKPPPSTATPPPSRRPSARKMSVGEEPAEETTSGTAPQQILTRRISFGEDVASRSKDGSRFGYSTLHDGDREVDVLASLVAAKGTAALSGEDDGEGEDNGGDEEEGGSGINGDNPTDNDRDRQDDDYDGRGGEEDDAGGGDTADGSPDAESESDGTATEDGYDPVMATSRSRSLSQTFWPHHQALDSGVHASTTMQATVTRLEAELASLKTENSSLRAVMATPQASARLFVAEMNEELREAAGDSTSPTRAAAAAEHSRRATVDVALVNADGQKRKPMFSTSPEVVAGSLRNRVVSTANTIWGMKAIFETPDSDEDAGDGNV